MKVAFQPASTGRIFTSSIFRVYLGRGDLQCRYLLLKSRAPSLILPLIKSCRTCACVLQYSLTITLYKATSRHCYTSNIPRRRKRGRQLSAPPPVPTRLDLPAQEGLQVAAKLPSPGASKRDLKREKTNQGAVPFAPNQASSVLEFRAQQANTSSFSANASSCSLESATNLSVDLSNRTNPRRHACRALFHHRLLRRWSSRGRQ